MPAAAAGPFIRPSRPGWSSAPPDEKADEQVLFNGVEGDVFALLVAMALAAGVVDSIAGGGSLLTLPALLAAGFTPVMAIATDHLQGCFGTLSAAMHFTRRGAVRPRDLTPAIVATSVGAALGAIVVQRIDTSALASVLPFLLLAMAAYVLLGPRVADVEATPRLSEGDFAGTAAPALGFYNGVFGPGTGSFLCVAFVSLRGMGVTRATAHTKVLNFTANAASLAFFVLGGEVVWAIGLAMAVGQFVGAQLGSSLVLKRGARLVRPLLGLMTLAISVRLLLDPG